LKRRRDFPKFAVEAVYMAQDGVCARCGSTLEKGFHRHHKDGNPANNSVDNLELLCPACHRATFGELLRQHEEQEKRALERLNRLVDQAFEGKMAGNVIEKLIEAISLSLRISRRIAKLDEGIESPPASIMAARRIEEAKGFVSAYIEGFKDGVRSVVKRGNEEC